MDGKKSGKVYIAGAGCGDEQLITLKLKNIIEKAECIIYDRLVNENILRYAGEKAELIYMGKASTEGGELQKEINSLIVGKAKEGLTVLRLKGGDPFVFGRGGEEVEALIGERIDYEIIPGITSAIAVPAYAGIPVTHRGINTSFHVFTGHLKIDGGELDFSIIGKLEGTIVFLMGLSNLERIVEGLLNNGKSPETPVAVIKDGTTSRQETYVGTLSTICEIVKNNNVKSPVIIVIGEVVNLREKMAWFEKKPLYGKNILITRNREKQGEISSKISELGGQRLSLPFINIEYLDFEMPNLKEYRVLLFNSPNSVAGFIGRIKNIRQLANTRIGAVGEKTAEELAKYRIIPDFYPDKYTVSRLAEESVTYTDEGDKVLFIVSDISPVDTRKYTELYRRKYEKLVVYRTVKIIREVEEVMKYVKKSNMLMFLSSSTFEAFAESLDLVRNDDAKALLGERVIASIGPVTTKTIEKYGLKVNVEAKSYTESGLLEEMLRI